MRKYHGWILALLAAGAGPAASAAPIADLKPRNYARTPIDEQKIIEIFEMPPGGIVTKDRAIKFLVDAGVLPDDAKKTGTPQKVQDSRTQSELDAEFMAYSQAYFGTAGMTLRKINKTIDEQEGYTAAQFLAYLRVAYGQGRCSNMRVGTGNCLPVALDFQTAMTKGNDRIWNLRYPSVPNDKWRDVFAVHREDIVYKLIFDRVAQLFGAGDHNPLRDIVLDPDNPKICDELTGMLANGAAFANTLRKMPGMPLSLAVASGHILDGVTEASPNIKTGVLTTYHYGMFAFMEGQNCSRLDPDDQCYAGEPLLATYLTGEKGIPRTREDGAYAWNCHQVASFIDTLVSNPHPSPYDVLSTEATYQFNPDTYLLRDSPLNLTAEDLLMFYVAVGNSHVNHPYSSFSDNIPVADLDAMAAEGLENPEFTFQMVTTPIIFNRFLR